MNKQQVKAEINAIVLYADDSINQISLGEGYKIEKCYLNDFKYKDDICDGRGKVSIDYIGSLKKDEKGEYFFRLWKEEFFEIDFPQIIPGMCLTDENIMCKSQLKDYKEKEFQYIHRVFSLMRVFKEGNIGPADIFFSFEFNAFGLIKNKNRMNITIQTRNTIDDRFYSLTDTEKQSLTSFISDNGLSYELMKPVIDEFVWGLEQVDLPTGFEQYTTALEMTLLEHNEQGKKQKLSNRAAIMVSGNNSAQIQGIHDKLKDFYRFRSESLHEGDGSNISKGELQELEGIVRLVLQSYLSVCNQSIQSGQNSTWEQIKTNTINSIIVRVQTAQANGLLL